MVDVVMGRSIMVSVWIRMRLGSRFDTRDWKGFRRGLTRFASRADPYSDRMNAMRDYTKL